MIHKVTPSKCRKPYLKCLKLNYLLFSLFTFFKKKALSSVQIVNCQLYNNQYFNKLKAFRSSR